LIDFVRSIIEEDRIGEGRGEEGRGREERRGGDSIE
jgi:hypothetical protein